MDKKSCFQPIFITIFFLTIVAQNIFAQIQQLSGYISDQKTGEVLTGATVWNEKTRSGAVSNNYGFFQLRIPVGSHQLLVKYVGYNEQIIDVDLKNDTLLIISLTSCNVLNEVVIKGNGRDEFLLSPAMSINRLQSTQIKSIPSVLGESDVMKAIQMLPGVSMTSEGKSSVSVRGGSPDQTLILLDGVPVYNVNHLFGFLSTFNSDIINSATLYKGGLPPRYGGRLSSVLDIMSNEGNHFKKGGTFSLGTMAGRLYLEGPIKKGKASYALAARRTWLDLPIHLSQIMNYNQEISYGFWDINGKFNWMINNQNRLYLSFYSGKDGYLFKDSGDTYGNDGTDYRFDWQNQTAVLRWNHLFSSRLFANTSIFFSRYMQQLKNITNKKTNSYQRSYNDLYDYSLKSDFFFNPLSTHEMKFGFHFSAKEFSPEISVQKEADSLITIANDKFIRSNTTEAYFEDDFSVSDWLKMNCGIRGNLYQVDENYYFGVEPRISLSLKISQNLTAKASYSRSKQFLHMLTSTNLPFPVDMWVTSTDKIKPGCSDLFSAGLFFQKSDHYSFSVEGYYTVLNHVIRYVDGASYYKQLGQSWQDFVTSGKGTAYGLEWFAEKKGQRLSGWLSYTLSWSNRTFESLNFGKTFPYDYDRRHQLKLFVAYQIGKKERKNKTVIHSCSGSFQYLSGNVITFPTQEYHAASLPFQETGPQYFSGEDSWYYTRKNINAINNLKMPDFHHLNIGYQIKSNRKNKTNIWDFSIYNVYNRQNVYNYYKEDGKIRRVTFFPIFPSVTFTRVF